MNKIDQLRKLFNKYKIEGYLIPKNDQFFNEFIQQDRDRLKYISNFSGSFGLALILKKINYLFTDGRYIQQATNESSKFYKIIDISEQSVFTLLKKLKIKIGFDPEFFKYSFINKNKYLIPINKNLIDLVWKRKKNNTLNEAYYLNENFSGENYKFKIQKLKNKLKIDKNNFFFISNSENICWLLNLRGKDSPFTPVLNCNALVTNKKLIIFCNLKKISKTIKKIYGSYVEFIDEKLICSKILNNYNKCIKLDIKTSYKIIHFLQKNKIKFKFIADPIFKLKSIKNKIEIQNTKVAHILDGVAVTKFIIWLKTLKKINNMNEISAQLKLEKFRKKNEHYLFPSFPTISGFGKNASIIHYRANQLSNLNFKNNNLYLVDSGAQYKQGTTDVTRTISFGKPSRHHKNIYTRVLKGHISVKEFNLKKNSTGKQIDKVARKYLNNINLDYAHGTGHGVGFFLNVHENPPSISKMSDDYFLEGQVVSNEPGFYHPNNFGIRIENLIYVESKRKKLRFNNLTLVPYDKNLINKKMLNKNEINYINKYHDYIYHLLKNFMNAKELIILKNFCSPI